MGCSVVAQVSCHREATGGVVCPSTLGRCPHSPVPAAGLGLVALPVVVPVVVLPSHFLPWWDHLGGMLSSDPSDP